MWKKAEELALQMDVEEFKSSDAWISCFKERRGLAFKSVSREMVDVDKVVSRLEADTSAISTAKICVLLHS